MERTLSPRFPLSHKYRSSDSTGRNYSQIKDSKWGLKPLNPLGLLSRRPLAVLSDVRGARDEAIKPIRGVVFRNIRALGDRSCFFEANRRGDITDLTLDGVDLTLRGGDDAFWRVFIINGC